MDSTIAYVSLMNDDKIDIVFTFHSHNFVRFVHITRMSFIKRFWRKITELETYEKWNRKFVSIFLDYATSTSPVTTDHQSP